MSTPISDIFASSLGSVSVFALREETKRLHKLREFKSSADFEKLSNEDQNRMGQLITAQEMIINAHKNMELLTIPSRAQVYR